MDASPHDLTGFMLVLRRALLMIVRYIEQHYMTSERRDNDGST